MSEVSHPTSATADPLGAGRDALTRHDWQEAFERLTEADREGELSGDDLEALALAAFFGARRGGARSHLSLERTIGSAKGHSRTGEPRGDQLDLNIQRGPEKRPRGLALQSRRARDVHRRRAAEPAPGGSGRSFMIDKRRGTS